MRKTNERLRKYNYNTVLVLFRQRRDYFMKLCKVFGILMIGLGVTCLSACGVENNTVQREYLQPSDESRYVEYIAEEVEIESDIIYSTAQSYDGQLKELGLDIYTPSEDECTARPAIIWVHGGGYTKGDKANDGLIKYLATDFAKMGYVSVVSNYRLGQKASLEDVNRAIEDTKVAFEWVTQNAQSYGIDANNIALVGYSAGGGIVKNLCYTTLYEEIDKTNVFGVISISGDDLYHSFTRKAAPACLAVHGTADTTVDVKISERFIKKLTQKGIEGETYLLKGLNHNLLTRYDEIRNQIGEFLYRQLTGVEKEITLVSDVNIEFRSVQSRLQNGIEYNTQRIDCQVDGDLGEWNDFEVIQMNQLKDAGETVPASEDYSGIAMVGWNPETPNYIYIAAEVKDDIYQDNIEADGKWYHDDCLEIIFDLSADGVAEQFSKYVIGAGKDLSVLANKESTEAVVLKNGNTYCYEIAIDLSVTPEGTIQREDAGWLEANQMIGFSIAYNDSDTGERESQNGWTKGGSAERATFGNLRLLDENNVSIK